MAGEIWDEAICPHVPYSWISLLPCWALGTKNPTLCFCKLAKPKDCSSLDFSRCQLHCPACLHPWYWRKTRAPGLCQTLEAALVLGCARVEILPVLVSLRGFCHSGRQLLQHPRNVPHHRWKCHQENRQSWAREGGRLESRRLRRCKPLVSNSNEEF